MRTQVSSTHTRHWLDEYGLFLFDLDGLLVNTEELHYRAYVEMCKHRGFTLDWGFPKYYSIAQQDAEAPKRSIYAAIPQLKDQEPEWSVLYAEKKTAYLNLLRSEPAPLLPGAEDMLMLLARYNKKRCVVTHSQKELVETLKKKNPILNSIPYWFTREDYHHPKPSPDGYLKAIHTLAHPGERVIGFEDSGRGMRALMATDATAILINGFDDSIRREFADEGVAAYASFNEFLSQYS